MEKFERWFSEHRASACTAFSILLCSVYTGLMLVLKASVPLMIIVNVFLILLTVSYADACNAKLLNRAVKALHENCDPEPLLRETERRLAKEKNGISKQVITINYCVAKVNCGAYQETYDRLRALNIDQYAGMYHYAKTIYYNNLSDACIHLAKQDSAAAREAFRYVMTHGNRLYFAAVAKEQYDKLS